MLRVSMEALGTSGQGGVLLHCCMFKQDPKTVPRPSLSAGTLPTFPHGSGYKRSYGQGSENLLPAVGSGGTEREKVLATFSSLRKMQDVNQARPLHTSQSSQLEIHQHTSSNSKAGRVAECQADPLSTNTLGPQVSQAQVSNMLHPAKLMRHGHFSRSGRKGTC